MAMVKCRVRMYDPKVTVPPLQFITLNQFECDRPEVDHLGEKFYDILVGRCAELGYVFKSYSNSSDPNFVYDVTVHAVDIN